MLFERIKSQWQTLRFRLMVWNAAAVLVTALAVLMIVREGVRHSLQNELDQRLTEDILEIALAIEEPRSPVFEHLYEELDRKARGHVRHGWFVQLFDARGEEIWSSPSAPAAVVPAGTMGDFRPVTAGGSRVAQHRVSQQDGTPLTIRVGASLDFLTADMRQIDRLVLGVGLAALVLAPAGGYLLAGRATRPLSQIISTTAALRPDQLDERLIIRNSGDELDRLSATINGFLDRRAVYLQQQRDFLANAAHELRTPLAAIRSSVEVALGGDRSPSEYEDLLSEVIEECSSLEVLVNQFLLLAEADAERIQPSSERVRLDDLLRRAIEMFRGAAEARGIELEIARLDSACVNGEVVHLRQVLNNLLDNAVKFTPEGGRITAALRFDPKLQTAQLSFSDTGPGIAPDDLPHIFERFFLVDKSRSRDHDSRGIGLGLSICQAIARALGGSISATSEPGHGSTFTVTLPGEPATPEARDGWAGRGALPQPVEASESSASRSRDG